MIGIHDVSGSYSDRWLTYCATEGIPFRRVDCLATDVVAQCEGLDALLWHWSHADLANELVARQIVAALEEKGIIVFPNVSTCWHFDDKVAQKYLLEAIGAPLIPTWVFTSKKEALRWIESATWPKVFKLRCGAGSSNVRLVRSRREADALCRQAFGRGFAAVPGYLTDMQVRLQKSKTASDLWVRIARAPQTLRKVLALRRHLARQHGYVYFQEYLPGNAFDTRITVIGDRAFGFRRMNRPNDFRASGSGNPSYEPDHIDRRCVVTAFAAADRLATQSLAFDFLFDQRRTPMIGEISYCYAASNVYACPGYWDHQGNWHEGHIWPQIAIIEDILQACREGSK
jgi:glutathione synthase/RimK-type ligase-like ATP-grasp enzyme